MRTLDVPPLTREFGAFLNLSTTSSTKIRESETVVIAEHAHFTGTENDTQLAARAACRGAVGNFKIHARMQASPVSTYSPRAKQSAIQGDVCKMLQIDVQSKDSAHSMFQCAIMKMRISAGIPFEKLNIMRDFLAIYCGHKLQDASNLRRQFIPSRRIHVLDACWCEMAVIRSLHCSSTMHNDVLKCSHTG